MKKFVIVLILFILALASAQSFAATKSTVRKNGLIISNGCVMSYTDLMGKVSRVIRGNPVVIRME